MDLSATLTGDTPSKRNEFLYYRANGQLDGIRQGEWKLLLSGQNIWEKAQKKPETVLFHLTKDISEKTNLASEHPEKVAELTKRMNELDAEISKNARPVWKKK
jgi:arylsulfatase A-like enzyme